MKIALGIGLLVIICVGAFLAWSPETTPSSEEATSETSGDTVTTEAERMVVSDGVYEVDVEESTVRWAGKKPLIDGYVNSGSIGLKSGEIEVDGTEATGMFTVDMTTLSVSDTPTKPGQETTLEGHLKGERWFDVASYPEASFAINEVTSRTDSESTFLYDIRGDLTLKGTTHELIFSATIYQDSEGVVHAVADFEFDRTRWGLTSGSGSFFDSLADNVIDDMVALSFDLVAKQQ